MLTLYEKFDVTRLRQYADYIQTDNPMEYAKLMGIYKKLDKKSGVLECSYRHGDVPYGRLYAPKLLSMKGLNNETRQIVSVPCWDIDIQNCVPTILSKMCKDKGLSCPLLDDYVANRQKWFDMGTNKQQMNMWVHGGGQPTSVDLFDRFRDEVRRVGKLIVGMEEYKSLVRRVAAKKGKAIYSSPLTYILHGVEVEIVLSTIEYIEKNLPGLHINAYIYDGILVERNHEYTIEDILKQLNDHVAHHGVTFVNKPFGMELPQQANTSTVDDATDDRTALESILEVYPGYIRMWNGNRMVYNHETGLWGSNDFGAFVSMCKSVDGYSMYGTRTRLMKSCFEMVVGLPNDDDFFEKAKRSNLGKTLWKDCIWDQDNRKALEFTPDIYFDRRINRPFPLAVDPEKIQLMNKYLFEDPFPNPNIRDYYKRGLAQAMTGRNPQRRVWMVMGDTSTCKSTLIIALTQCFGSYITSPNAIMFANESKISTGTPKPEFLELENARISYSTEPKVNVQLAGDTLKTISGGDILSYRNLYSSQIRSFIPQSTLFLSMNDVPNIKPFDNALFDRLRIIPNDVEFVPRQDLPEETVYKKWRDEGVRDWIRDNIDALAYILLVQTPVNEIVPDVEEVMWMTEEIREDQDDVERKFKEMFEKSNNPKDIIPTKEIAKLLGISAIETGRKVTKWGYRVERIQSNGTRERSVIGIRYV